MLVQTIVFSLLLTIAIATAVIPQDNALFTALRSYIERVMEPPAIETPPAPTASHPAAGTPEEKPILPKPIVPPPKPAEKPPATLPAQPKSPAAVAISPEPLRMENSATLTPAPEPSEPEKPSAPQILLVPEILRWTNLHREQNGIPALQQNQKLLDAAAAKLSDMFRLQYFEHDSPTGRKAADFVKDSGYEALVVGENLALGNFENEQQLVQAWMDSPGHRANILNKRYLEIGIAAGQDVLNGRTVWLSVQIFAKPVAVCQRPDAVLLERIETEKKTVQSIEENIRTLYAEYLALKERGGAGLEETIQNYNKTVETYDQLFESLKSGAEKYNQGVEAWNTCLAN